MQPRGEEVFKKAKKGLLQAKSHSQWWGDEKIKTSGWQNRSDSNNPSSCPANAGSNQRFRPVYRWSDKTIPCKHYCKAFNPIHDWPHTLKTFHTSLQLQFAICGQFEQKCSTLIISLFTNMFSAFLEIDITRFIKYSLFQVWSFHNLFLALDFAILQTITTFSLKMYPICTLAFHEVALSVTLIWMKIHGQ